MMDAMELCPMATMCKGMIEKPMSGLFLLIPGALLVLGGVLVLLEPRVLVWLMGSTSILIGILLLLFANFLRKIGARFGEGHR